MNDADDEIVVPVDILDLDMALEHYYSEEAKKDKKWSGDVETHWKPPKDFFKQDADHIAKELKKHSKSKKQAMSRLNFYINRAGNNLSDKDKKRLELAKLILTRLYDEEEEKSKGKKKKASTESFHISQRW